MSLSDSKGKLTQESSRPGASAVHRQQREARKKEVVLKKLRKAASLGYSPAEHEELALALSNKDKMKEMYFSDLLESAREAVEEVRKEKSDHRGGIRNVQEQQTCMAGIAREAHRVKTIEAKLAFRTLRTPRWQRVAQLMHTYVRNFEYGAFHAAIFIGDTVLEWNDSSLVIPQAVCKTEWALCSSVHSHDKGSVKAVLGSPVPVRASGEQTNQHFDSIVEKLEGIRKEKELLIEELVEVAVRYNTKHHYGVISNNCQHFVKDCLSVIGIPDDKFPFEGKVRELADILVQGGPNNTLSSDFPTHEELNSHVESHIHEMTKADIEFCICLYHLFHAFDGDRECLDQNCQEKTLHEALNKISSL